jgi:hypothetical protein
MPRRFPPLVGALLLVLASGCMSGGSYTIVEKRVRPSHFKFVPVVDQTELGPGGWRAACLHFHLSHDDGRSLICKVGVEMPLETQKAGPISTVRAQRVAAMCANAAADLALGATTAATPLGIACSSFIRAYGATLDIAMAGSRVRPICRPEAEAVATP